MIDSIEELTDAIESETPEERDGATDVLAFVANAAYFRILGVEWDPDAGEGGAIVLNIDTVSV